MTFEVKPKTAICFILMSDTWIIEQIGILDYNNTTAQVSLLDLPHQYQRLSVS